MKNTSKSNTPRFRASSLSIDDCMDILNWFGDALYDYLNHIMLAKLDGDERVQRILPDLRKHCAKLVREHRDTEMAYPIAG